MDVTPSRVFPLPGYTGQIDTHGGFNGGSDIFAPVGTPIVSMVNGTVELITTQGNAPTSGGNAVEIKGNDGLTYYYAHMRDLPLVKTGDTVQAGTPIGFVDNTGNAKATASHLHIGIGHGISTGVGAPGGLGQNFDAVSLLRALKDSPRSNDPSILGKAPNPPTINFIPSVAGIDSGHQNDIFTNLSESLKAGIDPFLWLGIVSKESGFDPNAKNPTSGACGYAQIYPCIPGLTPTQNIQEGLKRLKGFLNQCGGNTNCALNLYSGGAGQSYIDDVLGRAKAIATANPHLSNADPNFNPSLNNDFGNTSVSGTGAGDCPPLELDLGVVKVPFPDIGCIITSSINALQDQLANWWSSWQIEHIPNFFFVIIGFVLLFIGIASTIGQNPQFSKVVETVAMAGVAA